MGALERSRRGKEGKERRQVAREAQRLVAREAGGGESDAAARLASQLLSRSRRGGGWWTKDSVFPPSTAPRLTLNSNWMNWDSKRFGSRGENYDIGNCTVSQRRDETVATFVAILASMRSKAGKEKIKKRRKDYQSSPSSDLVLPSNTQLDSTDPFGLRAFDPTPAETAQFVQQLRQQWLEEGADKWDGQQQILYHHTDCIPTTVSTEGLLPVVSNMGTWSANTAATFNQSLQRGVDQEAYRDKGKLSSASSAKKRRFYSSSQSYLLLSAATGGAMSINERMRVRAVLLNNIISSSASRTWRQRDIHSSATALKAFFRRLTMPQSTLCIAETYDHSDFDWWERKKGQSIHRQEQQHSYKRNPQRSPSVLWSAVPSIRWLTLEETHVGQRILGYELLMDKHEEFNQVGRKDRKRGKTERVENEGDKFMKMMKIISWNKQTNQRDKQIATQEPVSDQEIIDREGKSKDASIECQTHDTITEESTSHGGNCKRIDRSRGSSYLGVDFIRKLFGVYDNSEVCVSGVASERDMGVIRPPLSNNEEYTNSTDPPVFWPKNFPHALTQRCLADVTLLDDEIEQCTSSIEGDICFPWRMEEDDKDCVSQKYMDYNEDTLNSHSSMKMDEDGCVIRQKSSEEGIAYDPFIRLVLSFGVLFHNRQDMAHALMHETKQLCVPKRLRKPGRGGEDRQWTDGSDDDSNAFDGEDGEIEAEAAAHIGQRHRAKILSIFGASSMEEWTLLNVSVSTVVNGNGMLNDNCNGRFIAMTAVLRSTRTEYLETMRMMPAQPLRGYYGVFVLDMDNLQLVSFFPVCDVLPSLKGLNGVAGSHNNLDDQLLSVWPRLLDSTSPPSEREKGSIVSSARDGADNISDEGPLACVLLGPFDSSSKVYDSARCTTVKNGSARRKVSKKVQDRTTKKNYAQNIQPILSNCRQYAYSHQRQLLKRLVNKLTVQGGNSSEEETDTIPEELSTEMSDEVHLAHQCAAIGEILSSIEHSGDTNGVALPITAKEMYFERLFLQKENITANKNSPVDFGGFGREVLYKLPVTIVTIIPPCTNVQSPPIYNDNIPLLRVFVGTLDDTTIQHDGYTGAVVEEYTPGLVSGVGVFLPEQPPDQVIIGTSKISTPRETAAVNEGGNSDNRLVISLNVDDWRKLRGSRDPVRKETTGKATELDENKSRNDNRECVGGIYNDTRFGSPNIEEKRRKIEKERIAMKKKQQKRLEDPCSDYWRLSYPYGSNSNGWTCSGEIDKCITVSGDDDFPNQEPLIGSLHSAEELLNIAVASSSYDSNTRRKIMNAVNNYPMTTANAESHTATILSASVGLAQHLFTAITTGGNSESEITGVLLELANAGSGGDTRAFTAHHRELYSMLASTVSCLLPFHSLYKRHLQNGIYPSPYSMSDNCTSSEGAASALILTHQLQPIYEFNVVTLALKLLFRDPLPQVVRTHQQACKHEYYCNKKLERLKSEEEKMVLMAEKKRDNVANGNAGRKEHTKHSSPSTRHITVYGSDTDDNERATNNTYEEELEGTHHQEITGQNNHHMQLQQLIHILQQEHRNATRHRFGVCRAPYGAVNSVAVVPYTSEGSGCQGAVKLKVVSAGERGFVWLW